MAMRLVLSILLLAAGTASGQTWPTKPVTVIVTFSPGGSSDIVARLIGGPLQARLGQTVIVDNRPGAGGTIAAQIVASAHPDGYTLLSVSNAHSVAAAIYPKLPYDAVKDFAGITMTASGPALLLVSPSLGVKSAKDLIALARARPGQLNFSSAGVGSGTHFGGELFKSMAGIDVVHIPFKGIPEAITETMAGRVQFFLSPLASAIGLVKDGKVPAVGVTSLQRIPQLPELPTVAESGLPGFRWDYWYGMLAPAKIPRPLLNRLNQEITGILNQADVRSRWTALGADPAPTTAQAFDKFIAEDIAVLTAIARKANIKAQ